VARTYSDRNINIVIRQSRQLTMYTMWNIADSFKFFYTRHYRWAYFLYSEIYRETGWVRAPYVVQIIN